MDLTSVVRSKHWTNAFHFLIDKNKSLWKFITGDEKWIMIIRKPLVEPGEDSKTEHIFFFFNILIYIWWDIKGILHSISTAECCSYCLWSFEYCNLKSKGCLQDRQARKPCSLLCWAKIHISGYENFFLMWHIYQTWCYQIIVCLD